MKKVAYALIVLFIVSCTSIPPFTKSQYISNFQSFVVKIENEGMDYSKTEWESADKTYEKYADEYYTKFNEDLRPSERKLINQLKGKYIGIRTKAITVNGLNELNDIINDAADQIDGILDSWLNN